VACPDAVIKKYISELSAANHRNFNDVNEAWANVDILIYTSTISASCSFELPCFTHVFGYLSLLSTDYKTAIQMMGCVRNISTREYHIFINLGPMICPSTRKKWRGVLLISLGP